MESQPAHPTHLVYETLPAFIAARGRKVADSEVLELSRETLIEHLNTVGYYSVNADGETGAMIIVLLPQTGKYVEKSPALRDMVARLNSMHKGLVEEILVIAPREVCTEKPHFRKAIIQLRKEPNMPPLAMHPYNVFSCNIPLCQSIPHHTFPTKEQLELHMKHNRKKPSDFRKLPVNAPPLIWLGARIGDIVRVESPSETAGRAYEYCLVTPPTTYPR